MPSPDQTAWLESVAPMAAECERRTGCPAALTLAQAIVESGWGAKAPGNNYFGIKWHAPFEAQLLPTTEWFTVEQVRRFLDGDKRRKATARQPIKLRGNRTLYDCLDLFCAYESPAESFADHARLLTQGRYREAWEAFQVDRDVPLFVRAIGPVYATAPDYADMIIGIMRSPAVVSALAGVVQPRAVT